MVKGSEDVRDGQEKATMMTEGAVADHLVELVFGLEHRPSSIFRVLDPDSRDGIFLAAKPCSRFAFQVSRSALPLPRFALLGMTLVVVLPQTPSW